MSLGQVDEENSYNLKLVAHSILLDNDDDNDDDIIPQDENNSLIGKKKKRHSINVLDHVKQIHSSRKEKIIDQIDKAEYKKRFYSCHPVRFLQKWISKFLCNSRTTKEIIFDIRSMDSFFSYDTPFVYPIIDSSYADNIMIEMRGTIFTEKIAIIKFISHCSDDNNKQEEFEDSLIKYYCHEMGKERRELVNIKKRGMDSVLVSLCILLPAFLCGYFFFPDPDNDPNIVPGYGRVVIGIIVWLSIWHPYEHILFAPLDSYENLEVYRKIINAKIIFEISPDAVQLERARTRSFC